MADIPFPRGVRDLLPNEALFRNEFLRKAERIFQNFGFLSIDTPSFESLDVLFAKQSIGDENKLIYTMKEENIGLRYDFTVSLARFYAMHQELPLPLKRYQIGKVWRREEPQKNRYREIMQCDVDILGGRQIYTDCEVIAATARILESANIQYELRINDRRLLDMLLAKLGIDQQLHPKIFRVIDKIEKIGEDAAVSELSALGVNANNIDQIVGLLKLNSANQDKLSYASSLLGETNELKEFGMLLSALDTYKLKGNIIFDFSVVRGLDYYTSTVFEFKSSGENAISASIGGGGRYDNLIGLYSGKNVPAVGSSLGIDRIMDLLGYKSSPIYTYANVIVNYINDSNINYALGIVGKLRESGINADINLAQRNITNQLSYANSMRMPYVITIGNEEEKSNKLKLRNLSSGDEEMLSIDEAINKLKK